MLYSNRSSNKHIYHFPDCRYIKNVGLEKRLEFQTTIAAKLAGYAPCSMCSRTRRAYYKNRNAIDSFCEKHNFKRFFCRGELYIISNEDTAWRICDRGQQGQRKSLFHESKERISYDRSSTPYQEREYHSQDVKDSSILALLLYISQHDQFEQKRDAERVVAKALREEQLRSMKSIMERNARKSRRANRSHCVKPE